LQFFIVAPFRDSPLTIAKPLEHSAEPPRAPRWLKSLVGDSNHTEGKTVQPDTTRVAIAEQPSNGAVISGRCAAQIIAMVDEGRVVLRCRRHPFQKR